MNELEARMRNPGRLGWVYPFVVGAIVAVLLVAPVRHANASEALVVWLYIATIISLSTLVIDKVIRVGFDRLSPSGPRIWIPFVAIAIGIFLGWYALGAMSGPVTATQFRILG